MKRFDSSRVDVVMVSLSTVRGDSRVIEEARALGERGIRVAVLSPRVRHVDQPLPVGDDRVRFVEFGFRDWLASAQEGGLARRYPEIGGLPGQSRKPAMAPGRLNGILRRLGEQRRHHGVQGAAALAAEALRARVRTRTAARAMAALVRRLGPAVLYCHDLPAAHWGIRWAPPGVQIVYDAHELYEELAGMPEYRRVRYRRWQRDVAGRVDALVVANEGIGRHLRCRYQELPAPVVVRNSHAALRRARAAEVRSLRADLDIRESDSLAVYIGGINSHRGLTTLVDAMPLLPTSWHVAIVGAGPLRETLMQRAENLPPAARARLHWRDPVPPEDVVEYVSSATAGLILYEPVCLNHEVATPNKLWEFAAAGLPIVASPLPALAHEIRTHELGVVVHDIADPRCLAEALADLTPEIIRKHADAARQFSEKDAWDAYVVELVKVVEKLMAA